MLAPPPVPPPPSRRIGPARAHRRPHGPQGIARDRHRPQVQGSRRSSPRRGRHHPQGPAPRTRQRTRRCILARWRGGDGGGTKSGLGAVLADLCSPTAVVSPARPTSPHSQGPHLSGQRLLAPPTRPSRSTISRRASCAPSATTYSRTTLETFAALGRLEPSRTRAAPVGPPHVWC